MQILYFWIDEFNNINKQPITLSSRYIFKTEIDKNTMEGKITISENSSYIDNFFRRPNIKNISAIIGKNGSGKTSILEYIKSNFPDGVSNGNENNTLVIFSKSIDNNNEELIIIKPDIWKIDIINETNKEYEILNCDVNQSFHDNSGFENIDFFYYTFFLDYKTDIANWGGVKNLSTSTLLCLPKKAIIEEKWMKHGIDETAAYNYDINLLMTDELSKAIQLIISDNRNLIPFKIPEDLYITISRTDRIYFNSNDKIKSNNILNKKIIELLKIIDDVNSRLKTEEQVLNNLYIGIFLNFVVTQSYYTSTSIKFEFEFNDNFNFKKRGAIKNFVLSFFKNIKDSTFKTIDGKNIHVSQFLKLSEKVSEFINLVDVFVREGYLTFKNEKNQFTLPLKEKADNNFNNFMALYMQIKGLTSFLDFNWRGLSTGQQSFLSFMARFHHERYHAIGKDDLKENLFIMIDEGDAGFHPEWQKQFFNKSLNFLSKIFNDKKIQLLYTSNSPYLVSDMTKNYITFIENKEDQIIINEKENNREETFGQNIHTLLSNSFFLETGLIGDFAKELIDNLIEILRTPDTSDDNIIYARKLIGMIGEPVIRKKLSNMFESTFGIPVDIEDEIERTKKRLLKLESYKSK